MSQPLERKTGDKKADTVVCPKCGTENPADAMNCKQCKINLNWALQNPSLLVVEKPATWLTSGSRSMSWLGERLDGWADLLEGMANRAPDVVRVFQERVSARDMPNVQSETSALTTSGLMGKQRLYQLVHTPTGAAVAVYIGQFGRDLYIAWDLFIRPMWNKRVIWGILGVAAVLGFWQAFRQGFGGTEFSFTGWVVGTIGLSIFFALLVAGTGFVLKRNPLAFFFKELDAFDADDITAVALAVHKSLLQAADTVGIDARLLRVKEQFRGGRRDRLI